jgi:hypothetical protein
MQFLMGLNDSYSAIRGQILLINPLPSVRQAYSSVSPEEKQRLLSSMHTVNDSVDSAAMAVHSNSGKTTSLTGTGKSERSYQSYGTHDFRSQPETFARRHDQDKRRFGSRKGRPFCSHHGEPGHWVQTCYELNGYPAGHPKARHNSGSKRFGNNNRSVANHVSEDFSKEDGKSVVGISETQLKHLLSLLNKNEGPSSQANAVTKPGLPKIASRNWIIDSGATDHISSSSKSLLHTDKNCYLPSVLLPSGQKHSFETRPGGRPGLMIGSRVRWVNPGQQKKIYHTLMFRGELG